MKIIRDEISSKLDDGKYECIVCKKVYTANGISTHYWLTHGEGVNHKLNLSKNLENARSKPSWNRGLTKDSDERVRKISDTQKRKIASGEITFKGTPRTAETKAKISKARSEFLSTRGNGGFSDVKWFKRKDSYGKDCTLRGTWEVKVANWLDENGYKWTRHFSLQYNDGEVIRTYSPDFFLKDFNTVIEVKGYFSKKDQQKMLWVEKQNSQHRYVILTGKEISNLENAHSLLNSNILT